MMNKRVALLQMAFIAGGIEENKKRLIEAYRRAVASGAELVVAPLRALSGFLYDMAWDDTYLDKCYAAAEEVAAATGKVMLIFDIPSFIQKGRYSPVFMAACKGKIADKGFWLNVKNKDEKPMVVSDVFTMLRDFEFKDEMKLLNADTWILLECRALDIDEEAGRMAKIQALAEEVPEMIYVNQVGEADYYVMAGGSMIFEDYGKKRWDWPMFEETAPDFMPEKPSSQPISVLYEQKTALIHDALVCAIRSYGYRCGIKSAVVGLSGGIDSAVVLPLAVEAFGAENVFGVMMPSRFSSEHSVNDAVALAQNTGIKYEIIPIDPIYTAYLQQLEPLFKDTPFGLAEENLQARIRCGLLMGVSNKRGGLVLNTSNKSEAACGYGTLYGDLCGGISVLGDLYKSQVYDVARYINRFGEVVPQNCITKAPSAELRPNQKDSDSLPDYDLIEKILRLHLEQDRTAEEMVASEGLPEDAVRQVLRLLKNNAYKRLQAPPALRLSSTPLAEYVG